MMYVLLNGGGKEESDLYVEVRKVIVLFLIRTNSREGALVVTRMYRARVWRYASIITCIHTEGGCM